jgi:serpin B
VALAIIVIFQVVKRSEIRQFQAGLTKGRESFEPRDSLLESYNAMGFDVFSQLVKSHPGQNVLLSPASLAQSLAMLAEGAAGSTRDEIARALRLSSSNLHGLALSNAAMLKELAPLDPALNVTFADSLWINQNESVEQNYVSRMERYFGAQVWPMDVGSPNTPDTINKWVNAHTYGRISRIVSGPFDPDLSMILLDTLYFKGEWMSPFDSVVTQDAPFTLLDGATVRRPQMRRLVEAYYCDNPLFQAVQLMFNDGDLGRFKVNMVVFLPKETSLFDTFLDSLNTANWIQWQRTFKLLGGTVALPRFKISAQYDMTRSLQAAGMRSAFIREQADFRLISSNKLWVTECRHAATLDVNEPGAEAASATEISLGRGMGPPPESFSMIVNRPFVVAIYSGDTILFIAAITDPG